VAVADVQPGEVDEGFQRVPAGRCVERLGAEVDVSLAPAQGPGEFGQAAVAGDQCGLVAGGGGQTAARG
jgi:hypothetical protein